ncbi:unnamed protein product [Strongylus vulgaris]|uniref:Transcription initiation factor TFIID component TAF4 C-terminal domain-containing protein n=1 Tax=Strongylus vulgaris TaxID=40348 RepID=A0A3P7J8M8_STRVU|nr:unnamed protein product [Strongylus vulgaris]
MTDNRVTIRQHRLINQIRIFIDMESRYTVELERDYDLLTHYIATVQAMEYVPFEITVDLHNRIDTYKPTIQQSMRSLLDSVIYLRRKPEEEIWDKLGLPMTLIHVISVKGNHNTQGKSLSFPNKANVLMAEYDIPYDYFDSDYVPVYDTLLAPSPEDGDTSKSIEETVLELSDPIGEVSSSDTHSFSSHTSRSRSTASLAPSRKPSAVSLASAKSSGSATSQDHYDITVRFPKMPENGEVLRVDCGRKVQTLVNYLLTLLKRMETSDTQQQRSSKTSISEHVKKMVVLMFGHGIHRQSHAFMDKFQQTVTGHMTAEAFARFLNDVIKVQASDLYFINFLKAAFPRLSRRFLKGKRQAESSGTQQTHGVVGLAAGWWLIRQEHNRWIYDISTSPTFRDGAFSLRMMNVPTINCLSFVFLGFVSCKAITCVDAPCNFEKDVKIGVGGDCPSVVGDVAVEPFVPSQFLTNPNYISLAFDGHFLYGVCREYYDKLVKNGEAPCVPQQVAVSLPDYDVFESDSEVTTTTGFEDSEVSEAFCPFEFEPCRVFKGTLLENSFLDPDKVRDLFWKVMGEYSNIDDEAVLLLSEAAQNRTRDLIEKLVDFAEHRAIAASPNLSSARLPPDDVFRQLDIIEEEDRRTAEEERALKKEMGKKKSRKRESKHSSKPKRFSKRKRCHAKKKAEEEEIEDEEEPDEAFAATSPKQSPTKGGSPFVVVTAHDMQMVLAAFGNR